MKKLSLAVLAVMAVSAITTAQSNTPQDTTMISSGPWMMRHSTGDQTLDRYWFISDRTLNAAEAMTLRDMFNNMNPNVGHTIQKAIINAIDNSSKANPNYGMWSNSDWYSNNGMSDWDVYNAMVSGLSATERGALYLWVSNATPSQMTAVAKLVRSGGWANSMWSTSGMNHG